MKLWQAIFIAMLAARLTNLEAANYGYWRDMLEFLLLLGIYAVGWWAFKTLVDRPQS